MCKVIDYFKLRITKGILYLFGSEQQNKKKPQSFSVIFSLISHNILDNWIPFVGTSVMGA